ncbi:hypothetical protein HRI_004091400 [Hibiscus trionum]|uniref:SAM domain-containing protein n=1 Tax=Hibiscus trionum TaxID=183268 RepID=A0A9W7IXM2_HIBTR|nr:hypothetical protein HRI_004091400 [Hibiscus trionum]
MAKLTVTITREGSNKVVKMGDDAIVGHGRMNGNKRFLHDKPWRNVGNKRHRADGAEWRSNGIRGKASRIAPQKDLRFKLMRKRGTLHFGEAFEDRRRRDSEKLLKHVQAPQNLRKHMYRIGPNRISNPSRITRNGIEDGLHIYSMQTADESRDFPNIPQTIPTALARNDLFLSTGVLDPSRESGPMHDREKAITSRPVTYVAPISSILQRKPHDKEPFTVSTLLNSLGLGKYAIHFMAEEVDMTALRQMGDRDLKELGIPMGPRKKLLLALRLHSRRHLPRIIRL